MSQKLNILLIEGETALGKFLINSLTLNDYHVTKISTGKEALSFAMSNYPDFILLDLEITDIDGIEVLKGLRQWSDVPIMAISSRTQERDKVEAFNLGVDDYLVKPIGISELLVRIRAILKRSQKVIAQGQMASSEIKIKDLFIDFDKRIVKQEGKEVHLTPIEYRIFTMFALNVGKVLTSDFIMKEIWGPFSGDRHILRVNIANIRRKIEINPAEPEYILTVAGIGYRLAEF